MDWHVTYRVPTQEISEDITDEVSVSVDTSQGAFGGFTCFRIPNKYYKTFGSFRLLFLSSPFTLRADHEYNIKFSYGHIFSLPLNCSASLVVYTSSGELYKSIPIYSGSTSSQNKAITPDFNFLVKSADLPDGYVCRLSVSFEEINNANTTADGRICISPQIEVTDLDDDSSWLERILQAILEIPSKIESFFSNLGATIGSFFTDLRENIIQKFEDLKQWFNDLGDRISGFFDDLKLKIETTFQAAVDEIKSWFIPSDGFMEKYNEKWLNWCDEHLGVLVQFPEILVDLIHRLNDVMSPNSYVFTFPEISVPIAGRTYVFVEEQTVDMSFWLNGQTTTKYLYDVYTVCVYAIFIFALFKYIQHIDEKIMSKG